MLGIINEQDRVFAPEQLTIWSTESYNKWSEEGSDIKYLEPGLSKCFSSFCQMIDYG